MRDLAWFDVFAVPLPFDPANVVVAATLPGDPASKERPRTVTNEHGTRTYTPARTRDAEAAVTLQVRAAMRGQPRHDIAFAVVFAFHLKGWRRRDTDNMEKLVLDACNHVVWDDDSQVLETHVALRRDAAVPRTEFAAISLGPLPRR